MTAKIYYSPTAYQSGFGSALYKKVCGHTAAEREAVIQGEIVVFDCGRPSGGNNGTGTTLRQITYRRGYWNPRVPSAEIIARVERADYVYLTSDGTVVSPTEATL